MPPSPDVPTSGRNVGAKVCNAGPRGAMSRGCCEESLLAEVHDYTGSLL